MGGGRLLRQRRVHAVFPILAPSDRVAAIARYAKKFPVVRPDRAPALIRAALERIAWYELAPDRGYFIDNSKGFGHRDEIPLP